MRERRYRTIKFQPELLAQIVGTGIPAGITLDDPVPDLRIISVRDSPWDNTFEFLCYSPSWEVVAEAEEVPIWNPIYRRGDA